MDPTYRKFHPMEESRTAPLGMYTASLLGVWMLTHNSLVLWLGLPKLFFGWATWLYSRASSCLGVQESLLVLFGGLYRTLGIEPGWLAKPRNFQACWGITELLLGAGFLPSDMFGLGKALSNPPSVLQAPELSPAPSLLRHLVLA